MKNDNYLKVILTVIAVSLVVLVLQNFNLVQTAQAEDVNDQKFVTIPVNDDGSINVHVLSGEMMDVNIKEVGGDYVKRAIPITPDRNILDVNINEVGGWSVSSGVLPVENKY